MQTSRVRSANARRKGRASGRRTRGAKVARPVDERAAQRSRVRSASESVLSLKNIRKEAKAAYKNDERYTLFQAHVDGIIKSLDKRHPPLPVKTDGAKADGAPSQSEVSGKEEGTAVSVELSSPTGPNENENANADVVVPALTSTGGGKAPEEPEPEAKDEEFVVEKIVGKKTEEGDVLYHVKWQGYGEEDNTWEPVSNFNDDAPIAAYEEAIKKGKEENEGPVITAKMEGSSAVEEGPAWI